MCWHKWGKWGPLETTTIAASPVPVMVQRRICEKCGLVDTRVSVVKDDK